MHMAGRQIHAAADRRLGLAMLNAPTNLLNDRDGQLGGRGVLRLLVASGPTAIPGLVAAVVVDAIDGMFGRRLASHVGEECWEAVRPTFAHGDPASAIAIGARMHVACAALLHPA